MRLPLVLTFTALTFLSWGAYGPMLHRGSEALHHDSLRAFVGVGLAYFLIAVMFPVALLRLNKESGKWTIRGSVFSFLAGAVGAIGALGVIFALVYGGNPVYVMPLVFGFAPIVNTLVTATLSRTFNQIRPVFIGGVIAAAIGAAGVLYFKPAPAKAPQSTPPTNTPHADTDGPAIDTTDSASNQPDTDQSDSNDADGNNGELNDAEIGDANPSDMEKAQSDSDSPDAENEATNHSATSGPDYGKVIASIVLAALCWGSYGPLLHIGQGKMHGSRLRPFVCVGVAYFIIAVAAPLAVIASNSGFSAVWSDWTATGLFWSFMAGAAGAVGALGVVLAFNAGGKPYYVMPLVFGFAPVVNTFISLTLSRAWDRVTLPFWICLVIVIIGAVTVLLTAPRPQPKH